MASRSKQDLHPTLAAAYNSTEEKYLAKYPGRPLPFLTCTYRSGAEQDQLFNQKPKVTNARAGQSPHNYLPSFAFDIAFIGTNKQLDWSTINFKNFADILLEDFPEVEWGGNFRSIKDAPHFELKGWSSQVGR